METTGLHLTVNGDPYTLTEGTTLLQLLAAQGLDTTATGYAVALNKQLVRRKDWPTTELNTGDAIEIVYARQGG